MRNSQKIETRTLIGRYAASPDITNFAVRRAHYATPARERPRTAASPSETRAPRPSTPPPPPPRAPRPSQRHRARHGRARRRVARVFGADAAAAPWTSSFGPRGRREPSPRGDRTRVPFEPPPRRDVDDGQVRPRGASPRDSPRALPPRARRRPRAGTRHARLPAINGRADASSSSSSSSSLRVVPLRPQGVVVGRARIAAERRPGAREVRAAREREREVLPRRRDGLGLGRGLAVRDADGLRGVSENIRHRGRVRRLELTRRQAARVAVVPVEVHGRVRRRVPVPPRGVGDPDGAVHGGGVARAGVHSRVRGELARLGGAGRGE